jgi:hypothetical protein
MDGRMSALENSADLPLPLIWQALPASSLSHSWDITRFLVGQCPLLRGPWSRSDPEPALPALVNPRLRSLAQHRRLQQRSALES